MSFTTRRKRNIEGARANKALKPKVGRPSAYTVEAARKICESLASGELLIDVCKKGGMPSLPAVYRWQEAHPEFREAYVRAREMQGHAAAERAVKSGRAATATNAAAARVKFDADRWFAAKLAPKTYGDKIDANVTGNLTLSGLIADSFKIATTKTE